jgi:acyl dehydratase
MMMRIVADGYLLNSSSMGAPGVEEIRWLAPVRPGDVLRGRSTILDARASEKDPGRGTVYTLNEVLNQGDVVVMTLKARGFFARRPATAT